VSLKQEQTSSAKSEYTNETTRALNTEIIAVSLVLTQLTTGGNNEADIATPIKGPLLPCSRATATPVPDGRAQRTPIQSDL